MCSPRSGTLESREASTKMECTHKSRDLSPNNRLSILFLGRSPPVRLLSGKLTDRLASRVARTGLENEDRARESVLRDCSRFILAINCRRRANVNMSPGRSNRERNR